MPIVHETEPTEEEIAASMLAGDELFNEIVERLDDEDEPLGTAFSLWCNLTRYLAEGGWNPDELAKDAAYHAADQMTEGNA